MVYKAMKYGFEWDLKIKAWIVKGRRDAIPDCRGNLLSKGAALEHCLGSERPLGCLWWGFDLEHFFQPWHC